MFMEKKKRVRFLRVGKQKKSEKLELVHTYVCGPAQVQSLGISHYYVTFIDDETRKIWVYFNRKKYEVFDTFKKWKSLAENQTGKRLKCLRYDNGGEYCSKEFGSYCSHNGIQREKIVPGTPQENGVSERMNRMIMECARCMRLHAGFPCSFLFYKNYSFLRNFGCEAFVNIYKENRTKF